MSLFRPMGADGGLQRNVNPGDVLLLGETLNPATTVGASTLTAAQLVSGILVRTGPAGAFIDTTDSAANIIASAIVGSSAFVGTGALNPYAVQQGVTFRLRYINQSAFAMTLAAGTGVTLGVNTNCAASSVKEYIVTITNGYSLQAFLSTIVNASPVVTGLTQSQTNMLGAGMLVTGTNVPAGTLIASVQPGVGITLNANATGSGTAVLTFNPTVRIDSLGQSAL